MTLIMPVSRAVYCEDCGAVSNSTQNCLACGSSALMNLSAILNRGGGEKRHATVATAKVQIS